MHKTDLYLEGAIKEVLIFKVTLFVDIELKEMYNQIDFT